MKVIASYSIKGGVGKTATAVNLAYTAAAAGYRTLVWDLDPQGAASFYFRVSVKDKNRAHKLISGKKSMKRFLKGTDFERLHVLPADFSYRNLDLELFSTEHPEKLLDELMAVLSQQYDLVILDCPPSISLASDSVFNAADLIVVPTIPTVLSLNTLRQLLDYLRQSKVQKTRRLRAFFCLVDIRRSHHRSICQRYLDQPGSGLFLRTTVPYASIVEQMGQRRLPLAAFAASSKPARAYAALWSEIAEELQLEAPLPAGDMYFA